MPSTNGHGPKKAVLYARVSTEEQAKKYSLPDQLDRLRNHAASEGFEVAAEIEDEGYSGAYLERPGLDEVRDLVAGGGVSVVLTTDRDRFSREPAYRFLLEREFSEHGTAIRSLNDHGDDSPEGQLSDAILDQLGKFERAKTAERTRRGKLRKAREGKVIATNKITYGFKYNESREGLLIHEEHMAVVRRIIRMVGVEGATWHRVKKTLEGEGIPAPDRGRYWSKKSMRRMVLDDIYMPFTFEEIQGIVSEGLISAEVAARLDPAECYGIWWFNRRSNRRRRVAEASPDGNGGRVYRWRQKIIERPRSEWIGVPVPHSGIPREWLESAREAIKDNQPRAAVGYRFWELAGVFYCGVCGCRMSKTRRTKGRGYEGYYHYYFCTRRVNIGYEACSQVKGFRAEPIEQEVWQIIREIMLEPESLREDLEAIIEEERSAVRGDPEQEARHWLEQLASLGRKRSGYQDMAAEGLITLDELRTKLAGLEDTRQTAEKELRAVEDRKEHLEHLEHDRDTLLEHYANIAPEALDSLTSEERLQLYNLLRLRLTADENRVLTLTGIFGEVPSVHAETSI